MESVRPTEGSTKLNMSFRQGGSIREDSMSATSTRALSTDKVKASRDRRGVLFQDINSEFLEQRNENLGIQNKLFDYKQNIDKLDSRIEMMFSSLNKILSRGPSVDTKLKKCETH
eukprot:gnl/Chilomastix_caulleri/2974.p1 GENE.gnl/Chilomastix_caulleri/2974~~gnl/Chilomastix_caulleri/2974.p1  ORF type:complete len:115 (+),score=18.57 gnl/Chilomastix_caulleri/2974:66-410(+)